MLHTLFRSLETCIHERLAMIEEVCRGNSGGGNSGSDTKYGELLTCIQTLESRFAVIESAIQDLTSKSSVSETVHVNCIGKESVGGTVAPVVPQMWIKAMKDLEIILPARSDTPIPGSAASEDEEEEGAKEAEIAEEEEEEAAEEDEAEEEAAEEEAAEEEAAEEEAAEEEAAEEEVLEEITFKDKTYYKDSENKIYVMDDDGELRLVGSWSILRQRVLFNRV